MIGEFDQIYTATCFDIEPITGLFIFPYDFVWMFNKHLISKFSIMESTNASILHFHIPHDVH